MDNSKKVWSIHTKDIRLLAVLLSTLRLIYRAHLYNQKESLAVKQLKSYHGGTWGTNCTRSHLIFMELNNSHGTKGGQISEFTRCRWNPDHLLYKPT